MEQPPGRAIILQAYREAIGGGQCRAGLARQWFDLRWKAQSHLGPDRVHHALRPCEYNGARIVWRDEALLPGVHLAALVVVCANHGSKTLPASPTGRLEGPDVLQIELVR
jgi:hypothetical protein